MVPGQFVQFATGELIGSYVILSGRAYDYAVHAMR